MVTDTAFRKSSLLNLLLEKLVSRTCTYWSYHTVLRVSVLNFYLFSSTWTSGISYDDKDVSRKYFSSKYVVFFTVITIYNI